MFVREQVVATRATGAKGIIIAVLSHEIIKVGFGLRPWPHSRGPWTVAIMDIDEIRPCSDQEVFDWRFEQGFDAERYVVSSGSAIDGQ